MLTSLFERWGQPTGLAWAGPFDAGHGQQPATRGWLSVALVCWARPKRVPAWGWAGAIGMGLAVAAGGRFTSAMPTLTFDLQAVQPLQVLSFTGPPAEVLTPVRFASDRPMSFDMGLVPGALLGAFLASWLFRELRPKGFEGGRSLRRYLAGSSNTTPPAACWTRPCPASPRQSPPEQRVRTRGSI